METVTFMLPVFLRLKNCQNYSEGESSEFADTKGKGVGHIAYVNGVFYVTSFNDNRIYRITRGGEVSLLTHRTP